MKTRPQEMDELLERIWTEREKGKEDLQGLLATTPIAKGGDWLQKLVREKLVKADEKQVTLTEAGLREAEQIIRRHRLAERLFADVFQTSEETWEREACALEHAAVLVDEAVNAVCSFLGHPSTCPHGRPIPRGTCCAKFNGSLKPFVIPLSEAPLAEPHQIVFITPGATSRMNRLAVLGILPGGEIRVSQKRPACVVRVGETEIALDQEVVRNIYVKRIGG